jgi:hypothetical protein
MMERSKYYYHGDEHVSPSFSEIRDSAGIAWFAKDKKYAAQYGIPKRYSIKPSRILNLTDITKGGKYGDIERTVVEWVELLRLKGLIVNILDANIIDVKVKLWDLLRGDDVTGADKFTDLIKALHRGNYNGVEWIEYRESAGAIKPFVSLGLFKEDIMNNPRNLLCPVCRKTFEDYHRASDHWHKNHTDIGPIVPMPWAWSKEGARFLRRGPEPQLKHMALRYADQNNPVQSNPRFRGFCGMGKPLAKNPTGGMFSEGNTKLGKGIWAFSLPRVVTCPGMSKWCSQHCYMKKIEAVYENTRIAYWRNYEASKRADFVDKVIAELTRRGQNGVRAVRIHVDGNFYSTPYIYKWHPGMLEALNIMRKLPNMILRASTDESTEKPPAGWLEAGIGECLSTSSPFTCEFYDKHIHCDTCKICSQSKRSIALKAH